MQILCKKNRYGLYLSLLALCCTVATGWYFYTRSALAIGDYDPVADKAEIVALYDKDRYWLTDSAESTIEFMLKYKTYDSNPLNQGKLHFKTLKEHGAFAGFTAYHMQRPGVGKVLFLAVKHEFRGKKYGTLLMNYAINELKKLGAREIVLITRTTNYPAQRIYESIGFNQAYRDETMGYIFYSYHVS